jgi:hypothetical protein
VTLESLVRSGSSNPRRREFICRVRQRGRQAALAAPSSLRAAQNATCVRIANALNLAPASPLLVGLICLAMLPCR